MASQMHTELGRRILWTLLHYATYVVDGGAGSFNMAFEAGPKVNLDGESGSYAAMLAKVYNLTDASRPRLPDGSVNYPFTALRVDKPGSV
jgi:hypothetical protein